MNIRNCQVNLVFGNAENARAFQRYLYFVMGIEQVSLSPYPFIFKEALDMALSSDLIIADALISEQPKGFQFVKSIQKDTLLLFYCGEIEIEEEGESWLLLPVSINKLHGKISAKLTGTIPSPLDFETLESQFKILNEKTKHHK